MPWQHFHPPTPFGSYILLMETSGGYLLCDCCVHEMKNQGGEPKGGGCLPLLSILGSNICEDFYVGSGLISFHVEGHWYWLCWESLFRPFLDAPKQVYSGTRWSISRILVSRVSDHTPPTYVSQQFPFPECQASGKHASQLQWSLDSLLAVKTLSLCNILFRNKYIRQIRVELDKDF